MPLGDDNAGTIFMQSNRNKKSVTVDPASAEGKAIIGRLIKTAAIVLVNVPPALKAMELDYESLKAIKSDIILTTISAFGAQGPWRDRVAFDGVVQVMSGLSYMTGRPGDPMKTYGPWADFSTAALAAYATLAALLWHRQAGEGQHVDASMLMAALIPATTLLIEQAVLQPDRQPSGNRSHMA